MKKLIRTIILALAVACLSIGAVGCGSSSTWKGTTLTNWGAYQSAGGFVAETENYIYFINGQGTYTDDNAFGVPVKGSLMAISKTDFVAGKTDKAEIVVPKLFVATDYNAGLYISGDYVYYGTPSLDKDSSGKVANSEMAFAKTKLDGTGTEILFTVGALSTEYRILSKDNNVYIVYYDTNATALKVYDSSSKTTTVLAKTDATAEESLSEYKFVENTASGVAVIYTNTVYSEKYYAEKAEKDGYERALAKYNKVYKYSAGDVAGVEVLNGKDSAYTYTLNYAEGEYVFYTQTDIYSVAKTFGSLAGDIADTTKRVAINDSAKLVPATFIVSINEVYAFDTEALIIYKTTLTGSEKEIRETVATVESINAIVAIEDGYVYYYNGDNKIMRVELGNKNSNHERVSEDTVTSTWYAPEIVKIGEEKYIMYCDNSTLGNYYVRYLKLTGNTAVGEDTDNNGEADQYYLAGGVLLAKVTGADAAGFATALLDQATSTTELSYEVTAEGLKFASADKALNAYNSLSEEAKKVVSDEYKTKFTNVDNAIKLAKLYYELDGIKDYDGSEAQKTALKTAYEIAKAYRQTLIDAGIYTEVRQMVPTIYKWNYQETSKLFAE